MNIKTYAKECILIWGCWTKELSTKAALYRPILFSKHTQSQISPIFPFMTRHFNQESVNPRLPTFCLLYVCTSCTCTVLFCTCIVSFQIMLISVKFTCCMVDATHPHYLCTYVFVTNVFHCKYAFTLCARTCNWLVERVCALLLNCPILSSVPRAVRTCSDDGNWTTPSADLSRCYSITVRAFFLFHLTGCDFKGKFYTVSKISFVSGSPKFTQESHFVIPSWEGDKDRKYENKKNCLSLGNHMYSLYVLLF